MPHRAALAALPPLILLAPCARAVEDIGECYAIVESYHHAVVEQAIPESRSAALEQRLGEIVTACESGDLRLAAAHLEVAKVQYETLFEAEGPTGGVTDADFWGLADYMWGNRSHLKGVEVLKFDMTGDGDSDYVGYYENHDNPDGPFFELLVASRPAGSGDLEYAHIRLPYDDGGQFSLCSAEGNDVPTALRHQSFGAEEVAAASYPVSSEGAVIDDRMCDTIRVFWPTEMAGEPVEGLGVRMPLVLDRN